MMSEYLCHHGVKGMKWGVRKYQNPDGSLTSAGEQRYLRNSQYVKKHSDKLRERSKAAKKMADAERRTAESMRKSGYSSLRKSGYNAKTAMDAVRITSKEHESLAKYYDAVDKIHVDADKKIKDIDTKSISYRKAKKEVKKIMRDASQKEFQAYVDYEYSQEHHEYDMAKIGR